MLGKFKPYHYVYTITKGLLALALLLALSWGGWTWKEVSLLALFIAIYGFTTIFSVPLARIGGLGLSYIVVLAAFLIGGFRLAGWTIYLSHLLVDIALRPGLIEWAEPLSLKEAWLLRGMDNAGGTTLNVLAGGWMYLKAGGKLPLFPLTPQDILPCIALMLGYFLLDCLQFAIYLLLRGRPLLPTFLQNLKRVFLLNLMPMPLSILVAAVYLNLGMGLFIVLIIWMMATTLVMRDLDKARHRLERRVRELTSLNAVGRALSTHLDVSLVLNAVREQIVSLMGEDSIYVALYEPEQDRIHFPLAVEEGKPQRWRSRRPANGLTEYVLRTKKPLLLKGDVAAEAARLGIKPVGRIPKAWLGVPLLVGEEARGVLAVQRYTSPEPYDEDHVQVLTTIAAQAAVAIENARLYQRTDEALAQKVQELEAVLDATQEGILLLDLNGRVVRANPFARELWGVEEEEILGQEVRGELAQKLGYTPEELHQTLNDLSRHPRTLRGEFSLPGPRFIERVITPVRSAKGQTLGWLVVMRDVTEARELEAMREDLAHMIVHDLRSPLASIITGSHLLEEHLNKSEREAWMLLDIMHKSAQKMLDLVNSLLDIRKMEKGELPLKLEERELESSLKEAIARVSPLATYSKVELREEIGPLPTLRFDRERIGRVLSNLLDNAIKFTPQGGQVTLKAMVINVKEGKAKEVKLHPPRPLPDGRWVLVQVIDTGPGIPPAYRERVFEKFFQIPGDRGARRGTGLGLAFCKLVVEAHGGHIWVEEGPQGGSAFSFVLPLNA